MRPLTSWDCGFEFPRGHGCLSLVNAVFCKAQISAKGRSLDQESYRVWCESDVKTSTTWRRRPMYDCCTARNKMYLLYRWFLVALCPFPEANQSSSDVSSFSWFLTVISVFWNPYLHILINTSYSGDDRTSITEYGGWDVRNKFHLDQEGFTAQHLNIIHKPVNYHDQYDDRFRMLIFNVYTPTFTGWMAGTAVRWAQTLVRVHSSGSSCKKSRSLLVSEREINGVKSNIWKASLYGAKVHREVEVQLYWFSTSALHRGKRSPWRRRRITLSTSRIG